MATVIGKVYETKNYDKFSLVVGNRPIKRKGVKWNTLLESIKEHGQLEPALVNERFEVINGQHRLACCMELGIPFKYTFGRGSVSGELIAEANRSNKWGMREYVNFYANQTDESAISYKYFEALREEFKLGDSALTSVLSGSDGTCVRKAIQRGTLEITEKHYTQVRKCLTELQELGFFKWKKENSINARAYWEAVTYAWRHKDVNLKRLIKVMFENEYRIPSTAKPTELLRCLSEIYNKRLAKANKVFLEQDWVKGKYKSWEV